MYFEIFQGAADLLSAGGGDRRGRLKAAKHEIIASGQGYTSKQNCLHAIDLIKSTTATTPVRDVTA